MKDKNLYDFDDLISEAVKITESKNLLSIKYLLIDEFQDINDMQFRLIKNIIKNGATFFGIGDPNQAIYGFRGSSNRFFNEIEDAKIIRLKYNYRSCPEIVEFSKKVIDNEIIALNKCNGTVKCLKFSSDEEEAKFISNEIKKLVGGLDFHTSKVNEDYFSFKDITILFRVNALGTKIKKYLHENGIPFQEAKEVPLEEIDDLNFEVEKVNLLSFHASKGLEFKVVFVVGVEDKIIPFSIANFKSDFEEERRLLYVAITRAKNKIYLLSSNKRFIYGETIEGKISPFLNEKDFVSKKRKKKRIKTIF